MLSLVDDIADAILSGFERHYQTFLEITRGARDRFERGDWRSVQQASARRLQSYDRRVGDNIAMLQNRFGQKTLNQNQWQWVKTAYSRKLLTHPQPELAESFYTSVFCHMFDRSYFHNDNIFVETEIAPLDCTQRPVLQCYPLGEKTAHSLGELLAKLPLTLPFENITRDLALLTRAFSCYGSASELQVLKPLFFRNKAAYLIGRVKQQGSWLPCIIPILNNEKGQLFVDCLVSDPSEASVIFGFARAYFMVDTPYPGAIVNFLQSFITNKSSAALYTSIGLQKHGKTLFYRDFLHHLENTQDHFVSAPGIKGMVMEVFTLPSYPFVFKVIRDKFAPQKDLTRQTVMEKYQLVKNHDRVGRMADTWEFSYVAFPLNRFDDALIKALKQSIASQLSEEDGYLIIRHCYIERRMEPMNLYLDRQPDKTNIEAVIKEYGDAIKQMAGANIFPGDMLFKNFGVTRHKRVIFYDYDEICYLTECNFRKIPPPRHPEDELSGEPWYSVGPNDVFPEEFADFLLCDPNVSDIFRALHADLLDAGLWQQKQANIRAGIYEDVFPYAQEKRFIHQY
ncbi:bifunctional isocitrate dehydrogenase kinase/phosphatase [Aliiglaciecola sp. CAU 1673]|uniref:bifunctional isocitrate dehydrogenase kinase/phosphatase n=1 Tax=Aliiglaciecola sp. CAU 1673 TaxID=3032595 RepID=UPI0023DB0473|nr:bifunctional isocitrate dehydrogenase kinase/phosphatase [Aliiglaciecola sp. CAU 1673]MDF2178353.1 bifunctional isocitrate dehydrogenase kinase/phosphatase [Aliiglaciecola sp. CAU 1673]